jgi:hypothetical protein
MLPQTDPPRLGSDGKALPPGMSWDFEIVRGPYAHKIAGRVTSPASTSRNACGALLTGLIGRPLRVDETVDIDAFKGQTFQIALSPKRDDPTKTYVTAVYRLPAVDPSGVDLLEEDEEDAPAPAAPTLGRHA